MDTWYAENLVCPIDHSPLEYTKNRLVCTSYHEYPVVDDVPVMLLENTEQTIGVADKSIKRAKGSKCVIDERAPDLYLESLGISEIEKQGIIQLTNRDDLVIDPVVAYIIGATSGTSYKHLIGKINEYPIPELRLPESDGKPFLELGSNWGRWSIAAARKGYSVVGIDPSLGAIMAARRVASELGLTIRYLVADARFSPFKQKSFNTVFSYSVFQHLSKNDVELVLTEVSRILQPSGRSVIQMPNFLGLRSLQHQAKRKFREPKGFEVRYWSLPEIKNLFSEKIGPTNISVDCYFGLGLQKSDVNLMPIYIRIVIYFSEVLRYLSNKISLLIYIADSVYVESVRINDTK